jgi:hypothetical protein
MRNLADYFHPSGVIDSGHMKTSILSTAIGSAGAMKLAGNIADANVAVNTQT